MSNVLVNKGYSPMRQFGVFLGVWGGCFILANILGAFVMVLSGIKIENPDFMTDPANADTLRLVQVIATFFMFFLPAIVYAFICFKNGWLVLGFGRSSHWVLLGLSIFIILASMPLTDNLGELNKAIPLPGSWRTLFDNMESTYEEQVKAMVNVRTLPGLLTSILLVAVLPAVFEEVFFRGGLQGLLLRWLKSPVAAIVISSLIFSAIHFSWYGFIPRFMLGIVLGTVFYLTGNIWYTILMHFVNNLVAVLGLYYMHINNKEITLQDTSFFPWWSGLIALGIILVLLREFWKRRNTNLPDEIMDEYSNPFVNRLSR